MKAIFEKYPRPWKLGEQWEGNSEGSAIVDANGENVLGFSEWMTCDEDVLKLIIALVNEADGSAGEVE